MNSQHALLLILVIALVTVFTRALPFFAFSRKKGQSQYILYLGRVLPPAMIAMLVVYCLKGATPLVYPFGLPELLGALVVILFYLWKKNTLLSIGGGTAFYMVLVQFVF